MSSTTETVATPKDLNCTDTVYIKDSNDGTIWLGDCIVTNEYDKGVREGRKQICDIIRKDSNAKFGGEFLNYRINPDNTLTATSIYIKKVIYSNPAVIAFWSDGTKTVAKCSESDTYNPEFGLLLCYCYRTIGKEKVMKLFSDWLSVCDYNIITLADVRRKHK